MLIDVDMGFFAASSMLALTIMAASTNEDKMEVTQRSFSPMLPSAM